MSCALTLIALISSCRLVVGMGLMLGLLLRCSLACAAEEAAPPVLCPPEFLSAPSGQTLEAHATACADWAPVVADGAAAAPEAPVEPSEWRVPGPVAGAAPVAGGSAVAATVARATSLAMAESQPEQAVNWRQVPGLRWLGQMRLQGGGLVLKDAGAQYFLKLRGIRGVRLGVKLAF